MLQPVGLDLAVKLDRTDTTLDLSLMAKEAGEKEKGGDQEEGSRYIYTSGSDSAKSV